MDGGTLLAQALKKNGVNFCFGVVGIPVIECAIAMQAEKVQFYGMRNEQAASYAAGAVGYMTGSPGCCLAVSGPGMVHAIAGLANAWSNCWPMILIAGANDSDQDGTGAFQETPQIAAAKPFVKYAARPNSVRRIPFYVERAVRMATFGRPGAVYLDIPGEMFTQMVDDDEPIPFPICPARPLSLASPVAAARALALLSRAKRPLIITGKGAAYARAEDSIREFVIETGIPFLPTPMGKGVLPDTHPLSVAAARTVALRNADVILLLGARLNWMLHFGKPPRFSESVRMIQIDICAEEVGNNTSPGSVGLLGDIDAIVRYQLNTGRKAHKWNVSREWLAQLQASVKKNTATVQEMCADDSHPMTYYRAYREFVPLLPKNCVVVSEGANTMDIGRSFLLHDQPRMRLDAGTYGAMGPAGGAIMAAAAVHPDKKVVAVLGDSSFGFSAMELEVACRHKVNVTVIILNNNGIYSGLDELPEEEGVHRSLTYPVTSLLPKARYEKVVEAFGGRGFLVERVEDLGSVVKEALACPTPTVVNVLIHPFAKRKPQKHDWLTRSNL